MKNHFGTNALIAALVLALSTMAVAQEKLAGAPSEGIKVHGHWTIEIRNPDGSLASHSEFENSLADSGKWHLAGILGKFYTVDAWEIVLVGYGILVVVRANHQDGKGFAGSGSISNPGSEVAIRQEQTIGAMRFPKREEPHDLVTFTVAIRLDLVRSGGLLLGRPGVRSHLRQEHERLGAGIASGCHPQGERRPGTRDHPVPDVGKERPVQPPVHHLSHVAAAADHEHGLDPRAQQFRRRTRRQPGRRQCRRTLLQGTGSTVQAMVVNGFAGAGIVLGGGGRHKIDRNRIGTDAAGLTEIAQLRRDCRVVLQ